MKTQYLINTTYFSSRTGLFLSPNSQSVELEIYLLVQTCCRFGV